MPFLRVIRDKRGYETTYLMHWYRDGNRQQARVLYAFRTPGGVRVGREALEPDVLKQIEGQYPGIQFEWSAVFHDRQVVDTAVEPRRPRKRAVAEPPPEVRQAPAPPAPQLPPRPSVPSAIGGTTADERVAFLAEWYPVVRERVLRISDPERQAALLTLTERLNGSLWTDADQVTAGLQEAGETLERLSQLFARRRRRSKKRGSPAGAPTDVSAPDSDSAAPAEAVGDTQSNPTDEEFE